MGRVGPLFCLYTFEVRAVVQEFRLLFSFGCVAVRYWVLELQPEDFDFRIFDVVATCLTNPKQRPA